MYSKQPLVLHLDSQVISLTISQRWAITPVHYSSRKTGKRTAYGKMPEAKKNARKKTSRVCTEIALSIAKAHPSGVCSFAYNEWHTNLETNCNAASGRWPKNRCKTKQNTKQNKTHPSRYTVNTAGIFKFLNVVCLQNKTHTTRYIVKAGFLNTENYIYNKNVLIQADDLQGKKQQRSSRRKEMWSGLIKYASCGNEIYIHDTKF